MQYSQGNAYIQSKLSSSRKEEYEGEILLLVQILLALAFTSVHYCPDHLISDALLRGDQILVTFEMSY